MLKKILSNKIYPIFFLTFVVAISVILLMFINNITSPIVTIKQNEKIQTILGSIYPDMSRFEYEDEIYTIYSDEEVIGYAFAASGSGYGGRINILVGIDSDFKIMDISILSQVETPGFGSKITESSFTDQFKGLSASDIALRAAGGKIDAITGATISSRALINIVRNKIMEVIGNLQK